GFCGKKAILCEQAPNGTLTWSEYSPCAGEYGVCAAGSTRDSACGNCGHHVETCTAQCQWGGGATCSSGFDTGCSPLTFNLTNAGCADPFQYRARTCSNSCSYDLYGQCAAPPTTIEVGRTVGTVSSTIAILDGSLPAVDAGPCPSTINTGASTFAYTKVHNSNQTPMTVSIFHSQAPGGTVFGTALAVYGTSDIPDETTERKQCLRTSDYGTASLTGDVRFASLDSPSRRVTIP